LIFNSLGFSFQTREAEQEKELSELREKKYKEWLERKEQQIMIANEFKRLKADEEEMLPGESKSSVNNYNRTGDHRAFQR
jgi:oligoendopeptidase F